MGGLADFFLTIVQLLCGGSSSKDEVEQYPQQPPVSVPSGQRPQQVPQQYPSQPTEADFPPLPGAPKKDDHKHRKHHEQPPAAKHDTQVLPPDHEQSPQPSRERYDDANQINQHNEHYMALRAKANQEGDQMAQCFQQSHEAYAQHDGARAKELSLQGKQHEREMERLNTEASEWIFRENNTDSKPGEIDLHGLYVKEAIAYSDKAIKEARQRGDAKIRLIVGKGLHSDGHVAKIKPALEDLMRQHNVPAELDPHNAGVLVVHLDGQTF
ncbi:DUF1771-domain-containing protein [Hygrophoropsis aurantiaca]|uniref:DUF1771-domain-containing protein n=1 Tax=Hygrophoropsis aurantiaca TaxID=72124 RepID=A0ACB8AT33_9AGAM|nr:DUF1771-domain-containing protein [Hygrophoropsis aurantiaca]